MLTDLDSVITNDDMRKELPSLVGKIDFTSIHDLDPSLNDGHHIIFDREFPMELRLQDSENGPQEVGTLEPIRCKVLLLGEAVAPEHIRIELSSENDLFFQYVHAISPETFSKVQKRQGLRVEYSEYADVIMKMVTSCIKEPHSFIGIFVMTHAGAGRLDFVQDLGYKFVELLSLEFLAFPEATVRTHIGYRYNALKSKLALMQARLQVRKTFIK